MRIREAIGQALPMLVDSPQQVVRHADIERAMRPAGEDIDVVRHGLEWAAKGIARSSSNTLTRHCRACPGNLWCDRTGPCERRHGPAEQVRGWRLVFVPAARKGDWTVGV